MLKFKARDKVIILKGKDKGKIGIIKKIIKISKLKNNLIKFYAIIDGINLVHKHVKSNPNKNKTGGIQKKEMPIDCSNLSLVNTVTDKKDKIYFKYNEKKKLRVFRSNGEILN